jgi:hypothetical protein
MPTINPIFRFGSGEDEIISTTACGATGGAWPTSLTGSHSGIGIAFGPKDGVLLHGVTADTEKRSTTGTVSSASASGGLTA